MLGVHLLWWLVVQSCRGVACQWGGKPCIALGHQRHFDYMPADKLAPDRQRHALDLRAVVDRCGNLLFEVLFASCEVNPN